MSEPFKDLAIDLQDPVHSSENQWLEGITDASKVIEMVMFRVL